MTKRKKIVIASSAVAFVSGAIATTAVILKKRSRRYIKNN
jgi:hypothetical protein